MFNERLHDMKYLVSTDAIGMGLNFNIRRIIFFGLEKQQGKSYSDIDSYSLR